MRFKRFFEHLRRQDWVAVAIELVIVVMGVFLGLQANNWNQMRIDDERAHTYLVRIHSDLDAEVAAIDRRVAFVAGALDYAHHALAYGETSVLFDGSAWKTVLAFYQASQVYPTIAMDATYREMSSVGDLRLIHDQRLSAALANYYANGGPGALPTLFNQIPAYRESIRGLTPSNVQSYIWAHCHRELPNANQQMIDCAPPISDAQAQTILREFVAEPQIIRQLRFWATQMTVENETSVSERADTVALAAQVGLAAH